jgi:hypothetical protein
MDVEDFSLTLSLHRVGAVYQIELGHRDPQSQAAVAPLHGIVRFELTALLALEADARAYGEALARQLFADTAVEQRFCQVETAAQARSARLRISLNIDPSAQELQALRWELLRHPKTGDCLTTSEQILLSRFMVSRDWRPVKLRSKARLRALVIISAPGPEKLAGMQLAPVDFAAELAAIQPALAAGELSFDVLGGSGSPVTPEAVLEALRAGVDLVYLVCHGMFGRSTGTPALVFQDDQGDPKIVKGEELTERVAELQHPPRLWVLASCQSAGDGGQLHLEEKTTAQATLAGRLADAGVPAILAMQGLITMTTVAQMMPVFFTELLRDGRIDRALAVARGAVRERQDAWMPALYTRLLGGRLWYEAGFAGDNEAIWRRLVEPVRNGKVVPIIGPRLLEGVHGAAHEAAVRLAGQHGFPLAHHQWDDLPRVTGYMAVMESRYNVIRAYQNQLLDSLIEQHRSWLPASEIPPQNPQPKLGKLLALVGDHQRENPNDPYRLLAELSAPVYVTTTHDQLLERALKANDRAPQQVLTRWRYQSPPLSADKQTIERPSANAPLVYHVFGAFGADTDSGLVLTEDNHFDYLIEAQVANLVPAIVESALVDNSLLFLGFRLTDWHFRVLFRLMMSLPGRERLKQYCHVAVQIDPDLQTMADVEGTRRYLATYFGQEANIDIYWGSSADFLAALHQELRARGIAHGKEDHAADHDDEWNF